VTACTRTADCTRPAGHLGGCNYSLEAANHGPNPFEGRPWPETIPAPRVPRYGGVEPDLLARYERETGERLETVTVSAQDTTLDPDEVAAALADNEAPALVGCGCPFASSGLHLYGCRLLGQVTYEQAARSPLFDRYRTTNALIAVAFERRRHDELKAMGRFPYTIADPEMTDAGRFVSLVEEVGEVARAIQERTGAVNDRHGSDLRTELVQVGAIVVAWVERLDADEAGR
jgi:hypothetical protein